MWTVNRRYIKVLRVTAATAFRLVLLFILCTLCFWMSFSLISPVHVGIDKPEPSNPSPESPILDRCSDKNWASGSAFFTIVAVASSYFLQPKGSHVFLGSGRMWRLSPLFTLLETLWIWN